MSVTEEILEFLCTPTITGKGVAMNGIGLPVMFFDLFAPSTIRSAVSKLKKKKYVVFSGSRIVVTKEGERYYKKRSARMRMFDSPFPKNAPRNLLLFFDIPEERKAEREWLRRQLRKFDYTMIQRSVWVGPSPLPKEFKDYVKHISLDDHLKVFKLAKGYTGKI